MITVILLQVVLPVAILGWLAWCPCRGAVAYMAHVGAVTVVLLALALVAIWAFLPWWLPYAYGALLALIVVSHAVTGRLNGSGIWRTGWTESVLLISLVGLAIYSGWLVVSALQGRLPPQVEIADIASPFGLGTFIVAHGGSTEIVNAHLATLDTSVARFVPWRGQSYALDFIKVTPFGLRNGGWRPVDPAQYETFGAPLYAPCAGRVVFARDGMPDMPVPEMDSTNKLGNFVAIDCGGFVVILAHLRNGSVELVSGQLVGVGDPLGEMGNSGNSSEPHLHIHAQRGVPLDAPASGAPLGLTIDGQFLVRNDRLSGTTR